MDGVDLRFVWAKSPQQDVPIFFSMEDDELVVFNELKQQMVKYPPSIFSLLFPLSCASVTLLFARNIVPIKNPPIPSAPPNHDSLVCKTIDSH